MRSTYLPSHIQLLKGSKPSHPVLLCTGQCRRRRPSVAAAAGAAPSFDPPIGKRERKQRSPADRGETPSNPNKEQRLAKVLASAGVASRRKCEELIDEGRVTVNGQVVSVQGFKVIPSKDKVAVDGREVRIAVSSTGPRKSGSGGGGAAASASGQQLYYFAVNKPVGFICSNVSTKPGKRAVDLLDGWVQRWQRKQQDKALLPPRFFTAGRLDVGTGGLVLVTNDGAWSNQVIHPSAGLTKEYLATVANPPSQQQLEALRQGAEVEGVLCVPKLAELLSSRQRRGSGSNSSGNNSSGGGGGGGGGGGSSSSSSRVVRIVVSEGKKHEVRILVAAAGMELRSLHRTRVGGYVLPPDVPPGGFVELKSKQAEAVLRDRFDPASGTSMKA